MICGHVRPLNRASAFATAAVNCCCSLFVISAQVPGAVALAERRHVALRRLARVGAVVAAAAGGRAGEAERGTTRAARRRMRTTLPRNAVRGLTHRRARRGIPATSGIGGFSAPVRRVAPSTLESSSRSRFRPAPRLHFPTRPQPSRTPRKLRRSAEKRKRSKPTMEATPHTALAQDLQAGQALTIRRKFTSPGVHPFDTVEWELRDARIGHGGKVAFEQERRRVPAHVVAERDEHRRPEVLPRPARLAGPRALGQADDLPRRGHDRRLGPRARLLRHAGRRRQLRGRAHLRPAAPDGGVQLAGLVQRRLRGLARSARPASS